MGMISLQSGYATKPVLWQLLSNTSENGPEWKSRKAGMQGQQRRFLIAGRQGEVNKIFRRCDDKRNFGN
jgi:hypothetical protein